MSITEFRHDIAKLKSVLYINFVVGYGICLLLTGIGRPSKTGFTVSITRIRKCMELAYTSHCLVSKHQVIKKQPTGETPDKRKTYVDTELVVVAGL